MGKAKGGKTATDKTKGKNFPSFNFRKEFNLRVDTLLDGYVWTIPSFLTASECKQWVSFMDSNNNLMEYTQHRATRIMASRECFRYSQQSSVTASEVFSRLQQSCPQALSLLDGHEAIACNSNIRLYKYSKGGATRFDKPCGSGQVSYQPKVGSMLIHLHGDDCLLHQGDQVTGGDKYVFRTDLVYPEKWRLH